MLNEEIKNVQEQAPSFPKVWAQSKIDIQYNKHGLLYFHDYRDIDFTHLEVYKVFILSFDKRKLIELKEILTGRNDISLTSGGEQNLKLVTLQQVREKD